MASPEEALLEPVDVRPITHAGRRHRQYLLPGLVIALAVVPKLYVLHVGVFGMDESILLIYPEQLLDGRVPNRDFFTVYGPGNFWFLAGAYALFGQSLIVERLVGLAYQVAIVAGVMGLTRRYGSGVPVAAGVLSALLLSGPNLVALSWMGGLALSVWSLVLLHRGGDRAVFVAGVLAGLAAYWRVEMGVLALAALPLLWRDARLNRYVQGAVAGAVPLLVHLTTAGREMLQNVFLDRMGFNAQREWSILKPSVAVLAALLTVAAIGMIVAAVVRRDRVALSTAVLALGLVPQALQRIDFIHVVIMSGSVVFPLAAAPLLAKIRPVPHGAVAAALGLGVGLVTMTVQAASTPSTPTTTHKGRSMYTTEAARMAAIVAAVNRHVPPGKRVFVGSSDMSVPTSTSIALYQLLPEYRNGFYYIELPVGVAEREGSPLVADIESAHALVLTDHNPDTRVLYPHFGTGSEAANQAVKDGFCTAERLPGATVYVAC